MPWVYDVHSGGKKIPSSNHEKIRKRVQEYAAKRPWKNKYKLQVRFKGQFCYVDAVEHDGTVSPLGRLRHFHDGKWSMAFYTYSNDSYQPCFMSSGSQEGVLEEGLAICEMHLI
jgi:hypothetical protein